MLEFYRLENNIVMEIMLLETTGAGIGGVPLCSVIFKTILLNGDE